MVNQNGQSVVVDVSAESPVETEESPLNQQSSHQRYNRSEASSAVTSPHSSRKFLDINSTMDSQTKSILVKIIIDFVLLCCGE